MSLLQRLWNYIKVRFIPTVDLGNPIDQVSTSKEVQQDTRDALTVKRVAKAFNKQSQRMKTRSLKAHDAGCDIVNCNKMICFKRVADKITSEPLKVDNKRRRRIKMSTGKTSCTKKISQ